MKSEILLLVNFVCTLYLLGLIWTVQRVHYKLFDRVGTSEFIAYESEHVRLITPIVAPVMVVELVTAALLVWRVPAGLSSNLLVLGLVAVVLIWLSTFLIQVPCHTRLSQGFDAAAYQRLVQSNWIRTCLWTGRAVLLTSMLSAFMTKP